MENYTIYYRFTTQELICLKDKINELCKKRESSSEIENKSR